MLICIATAVVDIVSDGIDKYNKKQAEAGAVKPPPTPKESSTCNFNDFTHKICLNQIRLGNYVVYLTFLNLVSLVIIWIGVMVTAFITGLQMWAGWRLLKSTDLVSFFWIILLCSEYF